MSHLIHRLLKSNEMRDDVSKGPTRLCLQRACISKNSLIGQGEQPGKL